MLKNIEKVLKRPFIWSIISVTEENGISHKMAIKKKLFNKKFVIIDSNGVKRETLIAFDGDKINFVDENIELCVVNGCENGERHTFEEPNKYQVEMGYTCVPRTEYYSEKYQRKCGMEFLIELFEHYAQEKNYDGLIDNRFRGCLQKINSIVVELKNNYDIKKLQDLYL